jgi:2-polyprenyl-6-methoxyphenol hydroxylase-like FAD-dependent oxidoreductase
MDGRYDAVVVGYGPVGQTLAILLGQRGWKVGVFEKQRAAYPLPRAVHFDHEVARILQGAGLGAELPRLTVPADTYEWRNADGETLLLIGARGTSLSGWPEANMFSQPDLERALDARVRALPSVQVQRGAEVVDLRSGADGVTLGVAGADGGRREVAARWVVGCDGANSFVRRHVGSTVTDLGFFFDWLIVDVVPHDDRPWTPINWQLCDPARPTTLVSGGPGRRRWEFMRLPGESVADLDGEAIAWRLLAPWGVTPDTATLERHAVYTFQARWVDRWRSGRLLLAGDAAHQMPPFAGQGMCSGVRDAANLAWKLDLVLAEQAPGAILDTYASERVPQVRQVIEFSIGLGRVICVADRAEASARDAAMIAAARDRGPTPPLPTPALGPGLLADGDSLAGHLFLQGEVRRGGASGRFDDVVGRGFVLVSPVADPASRLPPELAAFFASLGGLSAHVAPGGPVDDLHGSYARWFAERGVGVVLQRPDFHVFGAAATIDGTWAARPPPSTGRRRWSRGSATCSKAARNRRPSDGPRVTPPGTCARAGRRWSPRRPRTPPV